jgi:hypothetical protein
LLADRRGKKDKDKSKRRGGERERKKRKKKTEKHVVSNKSKVHRFMREEEKENLHVVVVVTSVPLLRWIMDVDTSLLVHVHGRTHGTHWTLLLSPSLELTYIW